MHRLPGGSRIAFRILTVRRQAGRRREPRRVFLELLAHRTLNPPPSSSLAEVRTPPLAPPPCGGVRSPTLAECWQPNPWPILRQCGAAGARYASSRRLPQNDPNLLSGHCLGRMIDGFIDEDRDNRIPTCHRMIGEKDDGLAARRNLDGAAHHTLARQLLAYSRAVAL